MFADLIFSLSTVTPIFVVLAVGYLLRRRGEITEDFASTANRLLFRYIMPIKLAGDLWQLDVRRGYPPSEALFISLGIIANAALAWLVARLGRMPRRQIGTFVQGTFRGNYVYIGLTLLQAILGYVDPKAPLAVVFTITLYNLIAVPMLLWSNGDGDEGRKLSPGGRLLAILRGLVTNPLLIGIVIGAVLSLIRLPLPTVVARSLSFFSNFATPLALLAIGASFKFDVPREERAWSLVAALLKLVVVPLGVIAAAWALGMRGHDLILLYVIFGVPTAVNSYAMVSEMHGDSGLAASIILYTTVLSVFSSTAFVFAFRTLGWI
ncbi:MAG: AEC family transporter [Bacillota bacterium]|nr:AEC family transporter [Bacillota bacterium]